MAKSKLTSNFRDKGLKVKRDSNYGRLREPSNKVRGKISLGGNTGNGSMKLMGK